MRFWGRVKVTVTSGCGRKDCGIGLGDGDRCGSGRLFGGKRKGLGRGQLDRQWHYHLPKLHSVVFEFLPGSIPVDDMAFLGHELDHPLLDLRQVRRCGGKDSRSKVSLLLGVPLARLVRHVGLARRIIVLWWVVLCFVVVTCSFGMG